MTEFEPDIVEYPNPITAVDVSAFNVTEPFEGGIIIAKTLKVCNSRSKENCLKCPLNIGIHLNGGCPVPLAKKI